MTKKHFSTFFLSLLTLTTLALPLSSQADAAKGKELFQQRCAMCHGDTGAGDGPVALSLPPEAKPRDLQHPQMKFATDDAKFLELLKKGGGAVGLNALMPPQPDLTEADLKSVIEFVHSLKK